MLNTALADPKPVLCIVQSYMHGRSKQGGGALGAEAGVGGWSRILMECWCGIVKLCPSATPPPPLKNKMSRYHAKGHHAPCAMRKVTMPPALPLHPPRFEKLMNDVDIPEWTRQTVPLCLCPAPPHAL